MVLNVYVKVLIIIQNQHGWPFTAENEKAALCLLCNWSGVCRIVFDCVTVLTKEIYLGLYDLMFVIWQGFQSRQVVLTDSSLHSTRRVLND